MHDSQPAHALLGREAVRCVTKPQEKSYFIIDFSPRRIRPTHYTLRHYNSWDTEALRNWRLEVCESASLTSKNCANFLIFRVQIMVKIGN